MTMQQKDSFLYHGKQAEVIAISHRFLFSPYNNFGVDTVAWSTANYRGFWCDYVIDNMFLISNIYLFAKNHEYPVINGKNATEVPAYCNLLKSINQSSKEERKYIDLFPMQYMDINYLFSYTGRIVLGVEPQMGMPSKERYKKIYELCFEEGIVTDETEITEQWKKICEKTEDSKDNYWWEKKDADYSYLIDYAFMGAL